MYVCSDWRPLAKSSKSYVKVDTARLPNLGGGVVWVGGPHDPVSSGVWISEVGGSSPPSHPMTLTDCHPPLSAKFERPFC